MLSVGSSSPRIVMVPKGKDEAGFSLSNNFLGLLKARLTEVGSELPAHEMSSLEEKLKGFEGSLLDMEDLAEIALQIAQSGNKSLSAEEILETIAFANEIKKGTAELAKSGSITKEEFQALQKQLDKVASRLDKIITKTVFWRCSLSDLNPQLPDVPADITLGIIDGEFYFFVSTKDLRPVPFTKLQTIGAVAGLGASALGAYAMSGEEDIAVKTLTGVFAGFALPLVSELPHLWRFGVPTALFAGAHFLDQAIGSPYVKTSLLAAATATYIYKNAGKKFAKGNGLGPTQGCITTTWPTTTHCSGWLSRVKSWMGCGSRAEVARQASLETDSEIEDNRDDVVLLQPETPVLTSERVQNLQSFTLQPLKELPFVISETLKLYIDFSEGNFKFSLAIGEKKLPERTVGQTVNMFDDDDDDDEDDKVEKPKKNACWKKGIILGGSGGLTALFQYLFGQGIATESANGLFSASAKMELRYDAYLNSYLKLGVPFAMLVALKYLFPAGWTDPTVTTWGHVGSFVGSFWYVPLTIAAKKMEKELKDKVSGKRPKDSRWVHIPLWLDYLIFKYVKKGSAQSLEQEAIRPLVFEEVLEKGNNQKIIPMSLRQLNPLVDPDEDVPLRLLLEVGQETLQGKYMIEEGLHQTLLERASLAEPKKKKSKGKEEATAVEPVKKKKKKKKAKVFTYGNEVLVELDKKLREKMQLKTIGAEKAPKWREGLFIASAGVLTLGSSYATQQVRLALNSDNITVNAAKMGEGVVPSLLSKIVTTSVKQIGKRFAPEVRELGTLGPAVLALVGEHFLMKNGILPIRFAYLFVQAALGVKAKQGKTFMKGASYTDKDYITPKIIEAIKNKLARCCARGVPASDEVVLDTIQTTLVENMV